MADRRGDFGIEISVTQKLCDEFAPRQNLFRRFAEQIAQVSEPVDPGREQYAGRFQHSLRLTDRPPPLVEREQVVERAEHQRGAEHAVLETTEVGRRNPFDTEDLLLQPACPQSLDRGVEQLRRNVNQTQLVALPGEHLRIKPSADADLDDRRGVAEAPPEMAYGDRVLDRGEFLQPRDLRAERSLVVIPPDVLSAFTQYAHCV